MSALSAGLSTGAQPPHPSCDSRQAAATVSRSEIMHLHDLLLDGWIVRIAHPRPLGASRRVTRERPDSCSATARWLRDNKRGGRQ